MDFSRYSALSSFLCLDTLELYLIGNESESTPIPLKKKGIAWWTDKNVKFRNPSGDIPLEERFKGKILFIFLKIYYKLGILMKYVKFSIFRILKKFMLL